MRSLLEAEPDLVVVGESGDGLEATHLVERLKPDVLILDLMMPGLSGLEALRVIRQRSPRTRVVVLSMHSNNAFVAEALKNGANAYVLKGCEEENLVRAVREAAAGRRYLSPPVTERTIDAYIEQSRAAQLDPHETLTAREREVLQLAAEGKTGGEIAARLHISQRHGREPSRQLDAETRPQEPLRTGALRRAARAPSAGAMSPPPTVPAVPPTRESCSPSLRPCLTLRAHHPSILATPRTGRILSGFQVNPRIADHVRSS